MEIIFGLAIMLATPAYLVLQVACVFVAWHKGWWAAFLAPLVLAVPAAAWCLYALAQDSNLWPLTFILFAPLGCAYLVVVLILRAVAPPSPRPPGGTVESIVASLR
jgi:hypothetical protein